MKKTNLNVFYHLGAAVGNTLHISTGMGSVDAMMASMEAFLWLTSFLKETQCVPMPNSKEAANKLLDLLKGFLTPPFDMNRVILQMEVAQIQHWREEFEKQLERENQNIETSTSISSSPYSVTKFNLPLSALCVSVVSRPLFHLTFCMQVKYHLGNELSRLHPRQDRRHPMPVARAAQLRSLPFPSPAQAGNNSVIAQNQ